MPPSPTSPAPDSVSPRRGRPGHDQRSVLRAAIELFNQRGYDGTSIGDIAGVLGISKSAIYHHVPSKERMLELALAEALDALTGALDLVEVEPGLTDAERLRAGVRASVVTLIEHLPAVTLLLRVRGNTPVEQAALARRRAVDHRLAAMVERAAAAGGVRSDLDPTLTSRLLFGMVNSLTEWARDDADAGALADTVTTLAFDGLAFDGLAFDGLASITRRSPR